MSIAAFALVVASCAGNGSNKTNDENKRKEGLTPVDTKVHGPLKDYFEIVDKSYKLIGDGYTLKEVNVEFKRLAGVFNLEEGEELINSTSSGSGLEIGMEIEYLDEDGNIIEKRTADVDDLVKLAKFDEGDIGSVSFRFHYDDGDGIPVKFRITSSMEHAKAKGNLTTDDESSSDEDMENVLKNAQQSVEILGDMMDLYDRALKQSR